MYDPNEITTHFRKRAEHYRTEAHASGDEITREIYRHLIATYETLEQSGATLVRALCGEPEAESPEPETTAPEAVAPEPSPDTEAPEPAAQAPADSASTAQATTKSAEAEPRAVPPSYATAQPPKTLKLNRAARRRARAAARAHEEQHAQPADIPPVRPSPH